MSTTLPGQVRFYLSHEERQQAYGQLSGVLSPCMTVGVSMIMGEMQKWRLGTDEQAGRLALIPGDPSLALVFPTAGEELMAAAARGGKNLDARTLESILTKYALTPDKADQSVRTLSGGERGLLALAKSDLLASESRHFIICNPEPWLSLDNRRCITDAIAAYDRVSAPWTMLAMEGESSPHHEACSTSEIAPGSSAAVFAGPNLRIRLNGLRVLLSDSTALSKALPIQLTYDADIRAQSPILLQAPNGLGKTTLALALSGSIGIEEGSYLLSVSGHHGSARLLMQNCVAQLFGHSPLNYLKWVFRESPAALKQALEEYAILESDVRTRLLARDGHATIGPRREPSSLLQGKIALIAARLVERTILLILDEPGFGLTHSAGKALMEAVAAMAARFDTALMLISHRPEMYEHVIASVLAYEDVTVKTANAVERSLSFTLRPSLVESVS